MVGIVLMLEQKVKGCHCVVSRQRSVVISEQGRCFFIKFKYNLRVLLKVIYQMETLIYFRDYRELILIRWVGRSICSRGIENIFTLNFTAIDKPGID